MHGVDLNTEIHEIGNFLSDPSEVQVICHHIYNDGPIHCPICNVLIGADWEDLIYKKPCPHLEFEFVVDEASVYRPELEPVFQAIYNLKSLLVRDIYDIGRYEPSLEKWKGDGGYEKMVLIMLGLKKDRVFLRVEDDNAGVLMGFSPELGQR